MLSQTHHLIFSIHPRIVRRPLSVVCLAALCAAAASAQCYLFTSSKSNASLQIQINTFLSKLGPISSSGGGYSYVYTFFGTYTLKVGGSTQVTTNQLGGVSYGYTTIGENLTTMAWEVAEPDLKTTWQVTLQSSQELMPKGLPQTLPPISQWVGPAGMAPDVIGVPGTPPIFYPITQITSCPASTGGGGGGGSTTPTISISNTNLQFNYTEGGVLPAAQTVNITNIDGTPLSTYVAISGSPWVTISETAATLTISVDPSGLPPGEHDGAIIITSPGATNNPQTIKITLTVTANSPPVFSGPMNFVAITPCRAVDTRNPNGPLGGPFLARQTSRAFAIPNSACAIPATAGAYSLNVAVVPKKTLGYVTVWPSGQSQPTVVTVTSLDGRIRSNAAMVGAGSNGAISVFASDDTDVILDINGYFNSASAAATAVTRTSHGYSAEATTSSAGAFYPLTPCRVADTRNAAGPLGGPILAPQSTRSFPIAESSCGVPANAQAYSLNFAAVPKGPLGFLTVWPAGKPQPLVASLNAVTGTVTANAVIVPAGTNGAVDVFATNETDLVIDIDGYFAAPGTGGLRFYAATPCRVLDSRDPQGTPPFHGVTTVDVTASPCGLPATAQAFVFNATVVPPGLFGYLTMWPEGEPQPVVATLNAVDGAVTSNMAIVPTTNGSVSVFGSNPTYLILDNFGYFAP